MMEWSNLLFGFFGMALGLFLMAKITQNELEKRLNPEEFEARPKKQQL